MSTKEGKRKRADAEGRINGFDIKARIWIEKKGNNFLAEGKVELLRKIRESGSISASAKKMNISYALAWKLVKNINRISGKPAVIMTSGGKRGGGAVLTDEGEKLIRTFEKAKNKIHNFLKNLR